MCYLIVESFRENLDIASFVMQIFSVDVEDRFNRIDSSFRSSFMQARMRLLEVEKETAST